MIFTKDNLYNINKLYEPNYVIFEHNSLDNLSNTDTNIKLDMSNIIVPFDNNITINVKTESKNIRISGVFLIEEKLNVNNEQYYIIKNKIHSFLKKK